ncbi:hypothetical protein NP493_1360g00015 [Ridgeia piscesae]|uniref:Uncharacterized protein n=1 Tax=Ridgeia piscesae TaxID=27915 RepID=A0AAD9K6P8_RIDPI|nr:hypothetical protein NP493_1360g00015 [Ridgeia piscesae]
MLTMVGLPLFYLELAFGQYASLGPITIWKASPLFKGVGYSMVVLTLIVSVYYNVIMAFTVRYLFASFTSTLPWATCSPSWPNCVDNRFEQSISVEIFHSEGQPYGIIYRLSLYRREVLGVRNGTTIENLGPIQWKLCLSLILAWIIVFLCIAKGIKSSGKVVYFTATFPYVMLFILFVRGVTLPGAGNGIAYYLKPDFHRMAHVTVWKEAAVQILYSLGPGFGTLLTMGSYNKFHNNCCKDAIIVSLINCGTSVFAGFVIFSVLGFMAHTHNVDVERVVDKGPELAFIAYPEALTMMPGAPFWAICFFFMLFLLGLDSQFASMECIVTGFVDEFPKLLRWKTRFSALMCTVLFLLGLPCVTGGGLLVIQLIDKYVTAFPLLFLTAMEAILLSWVYGYKRFADDIQTMIGTRPNYYWLACWTFLTPVILGVIITFSSVQYDGMHYKHYTYPPMAEAVAWLLVVLSLVAIPGWMIAKFWQHVGTCRNFCWLFRGPVAMAALNLRSLVEPTSDWGPALAENRLQQEHSGAPLPEDDSANILPEREAETIAGEVTSYATMGDSYI